MLNKGFKLDKVLCVLKPEVGLSLSSCLSEARLNAKVDKTKV